MGLIIDLSHHQPSNKIDWEKASKGVDLMILRVQYGSKTVDREYKNHVDNCKRYGIPFGSYAYGHFVSINDAKVEAKDFLSRIDKESKFLVLDTEGDTLESCGTSNVAEASQAFIDVLKEAGYKTGFYVSHNLYNQYDLNKVEADFLWIPRYGVNKEVSPSYVCDLWQFTESGKVDWYSGNLDLNKLNGNKNLAWFLGEEVKVAMTERIVNFYTGGYDKDTLSNIHNFLKENGYWFNPTRSDNGDIFFSVGAFGEGSVDYQNMKKFLDDRNYWYNIQG